jgi:hypothetical protein
VVGAGGATVVVGVTPPSPSLLLVVTQHKSAGTSYQTAGPLGYDPFVRIKLPGTILPSLVYLTNALFFAIK